MGSTGWQGPAGVRVTQPPTAAATGTPGGQPRWRRQGGARPPGLAGHGRREPAKMPEAHEPPTRAGAEPTRRREPAQMPGARSRRQRPAPPLVDDRITKGPELGSTGSIDGGTARARIHPQERIPEGRPHPGADHQVAAVLQTAPAPRRIRLRHHPDPRGPAAQAPLQRPGRHRRRGGHPAAGPGGTVPDRHRLHLAARGRLDDLGGLRRRDDRDADRHPQPEGVPALRLAGRLHRGADPAAPPLPAGLPPSRSPRAHSSTCCGCCACCGWPP